MLSIHSMTGGFARSALSLARAELPPNTLRDGLHVYMLTSYTLASWASSIGGAPLYGPRLGGT